MMRAMRVIYKPVFVVVAVTFIGWLAYGQVTDILGGGRDVVLKVNGEIVRATQFQAALQNAIGESRRRGGGRLRREDEQQLQAQVTDQFIQRILREREYRRLGIQVSDDEIRQMARSTPPPQILRQIMEDPTFQTNGQFDITKWQRYLGSASEEFRTQIEQLYREYLPERKLEEYLTADVYVSDAKLWRIWRDQHESVTVAVLAIRRLAPGELSQPAASGFGYHLIRVEAAKGDSLHVRHILIPIVPQGQHLDQIGARTDSLDHLAAEQTDGARLDSASLRLHLPVAQAPKLIQGDRLTLGRYVIPDVSVWAFEARPGETSPLIEGERANYVFRLDSLYAAGTPPLAQIRDRVLAAARSERKKVIARQGAAEAP